MKINSLNHSAHAQEDIARPLENGHFRSRLGTQQLYQGVHDMLDTAVKFELPEDGIVMDRLKSMEMLEPAELCLPFPVVALEYRCTEKELPPNWIQAKKRIALCMDYEKNESSVVARLAAAAFPALRIVGGLIVIPCYYNERLDRWVIHPWACVLSKGNAPGFAPMMFSSPRKTISSRLTSGSFFLFEPEIYDHMYRNSGPKQILMSAIHDCCDEIMAIVTLVAALSCINVEMEDHPASETLNKSRTKKGKKPLSGYKTLVVIDVNRRRRGGGKHATTGQTLRTHLRRGHPRRLSNGSRVWIAPSIVNAGNGTPRNRYRILAQRKAA